MPPMVFLSPGQDSERRRQIRSIHVIPETAGVLINSIIMVYKVEMAALRSTCCSKSIILLDFHLMIVRSLANPRMEACSSQLVDGLSIRGRGERFLTVTLLSSR
ncbi:hypothetical protein HanRHA438_Chr04g0171701 [Helianthus annuus]|nr:hypothetical protein HanRHA438_Chr04g0171701 [Helianthus annuus]